MQSDLAARKSLHDKHIYEVEVCMKSVIDIAENVEKFGMSDRLDELRENMRSYINMELDLKDRISILDKIGDRNFPLVRVSNRQLA